MLKLKSQIKNLGLVVALGLFSSTASATSTLPLYDTTGNTFNNSTEFGIGDWGASRFTLSSTDCPNGCNITDTSLLLFDSELFYGDTASLAGVTLSVYSDAVNGQALGQKLFSFDTSVEIGSDLTTVSFLVNSGENSHVENDTFYWLALENESRLNPIAWGYSDFGSLSDYSLFDQGTYHGDFASSPFHFTLNGTPSVSAVPVPGAVWMMGSSLFGLLAVSRRKSNKLISVK